jgi:hypothetical protein
MEVHKEAGCVCTGHVFCVGPDQRLPYIRVSLQFFQGVRYRFLRVKDLYGRSVLIQVTLLNSRSRRRRRP